MLPQQFLLHVVVFHPGHKQEIGIHSPKKDKKVQESATPQRTKNPGKHQGSKKKGQGAKPYNDK